MLTAFIFGMVHFQTYFGGDVLRTIVQILLVQGAARLIFNYAYLKTKSIWTSWIVHLIFDIVMLTVPLFYRNSKLILWISFYYLNEIINEE